MPRLCGPSPGTGASITACAWRRPGSWPSCAGEIVPLGAAAFCTAPKDRTSSLYSRNSVFRRSVYCSTAMGSTLQSIWRYDKRSRKYRLRELERTVRLLSAPRLDELVVCRAWHYHDARISSYLSLFRNWTRLQGGLRHDGHLRSRRHSGGVFPRKYCVGSARPRYGYPVCAGKCLAHYPGAFF